MEISVTPVKIARIRLGLTQMQVCEKIKMSPRKLGAIEKGNYGIVTLDNMKALSEVLGVSIQELFFSEEQ